MGLAMWDSLCTVSEYSANKPNLRGTAIFIKTNGGWCWFGWYGCGCGCGCGCGGRWVMCCFLCFVPLLEYRLEEEKSETRALSVYFRVCTYVGPWSALSRVSVLDDCIGIGIVYYCQEHITCFDIWLGLHDNNISK